MKPRIAVITGGGQGLGRAIADALHAEGYTVAILGRDAARLTAAAEAIGERAHAIATDICDPGSVSRAFARIETELGGVDLLVNNAAAFIPFAIEEATDAQIQALVGTNLTGAIYCIREAVPRMRLRGGGQIVNVTSESVRRPVAMFSVYAATKAAMENLSLSLGEELHDDAIGVMTFRAGRMLTEGAAAVDMSPQLYDRFVAAVTASGAGRFSGSGMRPESAAGVLVAALRTPQDARTELLEVRSA